MAKFMFAMTFVVPVFFLPLLTAIVVCLAWGLSVLMVLSYFIAKSRGERPWKAVGEHVLIAVVVIVITHWVGDMVAALGA